MSKWKQQKWSNHLQQQNMSLTWIMFSHFSNLSALDTWELFDVRAKVDW